MTDDRQPTAQALYLAGLLRDATAWMHQLEKEIADLKERIIAEAPTGTAINLGDVVIVRSERQPNRQVNTVKLLQRGVPREAFTTSKSSITKFQAWAEKQKWTQEQIDDYVLIIGDPTPTVSVRPAYSTNPDDANYDEENN